MPRGSRPLVGDPVYINGRPQWVPDEEQYQLLVGVRGTVTYVDHSDGGIVMVKAELGLPSFEIDREQFPGHWRESPGLGDMWWFEAEEL